MLLVSVLAASLRLVYLSHDLPVTATMASDEILYFLWGQAVRETGYPSAENGAGYPPGFLYLLAGEQMIVKIIHGQSPDSFFDYTLVARVVNGLFGTACVTLMTVLGHKTAKSLIAGLSCGLITALWILMVDESRRAAPTVPWVFFTLLVFLFLLLARDSGWLPYLYLALMSGIASFLFKYSSVTMLVIPFAYGLLYFRALRGRLYLHMAVWLILVTMVIAWLVLQYRVFEVMHTPGSDTGSFMQDGKIVGLQSFQTNWGTLTEGVGGIWYMIGAIASLPFALVALSWKKYDNLLDAGAVLTCAGYSMLFYLTMSFFRAAHPPKWLAAVAITHLMALAAMFFSLRLVDTAIARIFRFNQRLQIVHALGFVVFSTAIVNQLWPHWDWTYRHVWTKPYTVNVLNSWFSDHVPQGGRAAAEVVKMLYDYPYAPNTFHVLVADTIFGESVEDYRARGYEYLIWNDLKSKPTDSITDLDRKQGALLSQGAVEVLRVTGEEFWGPTIVVFRIPPLQQHPLYAWFTPAISFRGYDLNQDSFKPGEQVELMLYWMSAEPIKANYLVFVHILDPETGQLLAGQDGPPDYGNTPTWKWQGDMQFIRDQRFFTIPADAKPGAYTLRIGMYDADTKQRVQVLDLQNQPIGDGLVLQQIKIEK